MIAALAVLLALAPQHGAGRHGNPADLESYVARLEDPARDAWQKPDAVVAALGLRPGQTACDIGAGPGYFTLRLSAAVGPSGRVYGVDVEPFILGTLRDRIEAAQATNVTPVLGVGDDPLLPGALCDLVLIVDTYHHFPERTRYLQRLVRSLKPGGRIVNIDYEKKATPVGPPMEHRISRDEFVAEAGLAGLAVVAEPRLLPYQYFIVLEPRR
ncbi:MAG TPA: methyltransferase domain-containing protein [Vicinamibacteria bacterium]|nr:methyltransferase domain-containing protein [Vicinamibacteria bacterium]